MRPLDSLTARPLEGTEGTPFPFWSLDSRSIGFFVPGKLERIDISGGPPQVVFNALDGRGGTWNAKVVIVFSRPGGPNGPDIWILPFSGDRKPFPFIHTPFNEFYGAFSADGHWLAFESNESGRFEVYIAPFPEPGGKWQVSSGGGYEPRWRSDGKGLYYLAPEARLMEVGLRRRVRQSR